MTEIVAAASDAKKSRKIDAFSFGDPEPVLDRGGLLAYVESWHNGEWYEPPVSMDGLVRAFDMPGPHASCIRLKVNLLVRHFEPSRWLTRGEFRKYALDFLSLGNAFLERRDNLAGGTLALRHSLGRFTRRGVAEGSYFFVPGWKEKHQFADASVFHLVQEHPAQEIYGVPEFFSALQAGLLGEAATLFRRRYYLNGSHAGYILYASDEGINDEDAEAIKEQMRKSKGPGNFRNLFIHSPSGKKDGVQIIPIGEAGAKDEFLNIKRVSRDEMLAAHRVPPPLIAIVPENTGGFGDVAKAMDVFFPNEIEPLMERLGEINDWLGVEAIRWRPYQRQSGPTPAA